MRHGRRNAESGGRLPGVLGTGVARAAWLAVGLSTVLAVCVGCSRTPAAPTATATPPPAATVVPSPSVTTSLATFDPPPLLKLTGNACADWPALKQSSLGVFNGAADVISRTLPAHIANLTAFAAAVPAGQKADARVLQDTWTSAGKEMQRIGYDPVKLGTDQAAQAAIRALSAPPVADATARLDGWALACAAGGAAKP